MSVHAYLTSSSPLGKSVYLFDGVTAPAQYVPTLTFSAEMNKSGTNTNVKVDIDFPLLTVVDGVTSSLNSFKAKFEFTSLRSVINDTERERVIDELIAFLTSKKSSIMAGSVLPVA